MHRLGRVRDIAPTYTCIVALAVWLDKTMAKSGDSRLSSCCRLVSTICVEYIFSKYQNNFKPNLIVFVNRDGFGDVATDHWLGLQSVYLLTNSGFDFVLKVEIRPQNSTTFQQYYYNFRIENEANYYQLRFSSTSSNSKSPLGDSLSPALNSAFSTYDADHDGDITINCALRHQSGWWFPTNCSLTEGNPLGRLVKPLDDLWSGKPEDVFWLNDLGNVGPWKIVIWITKT